MAALNNSRSNRVLTRALCCGLLILSACVFYLLAAAPTEWWSRTGATAQTAGARFVPPNFLWPAQIAPSRRALSAPVRAWERLWGMERVTCMYSLKQLSLALERYRGGRDGNSVFTSQTVEATSGPN